MSKTKVGLTPDALSEKWARRAKQAVPDTVAGIQNCTVNPMELAAAQSDKWLQNVSQSKDRYERRLRAVPFQQWKDTTARKVSERMSTGVDTALPNHKKFANWLVTHVNSGLSKLSTMPKKSKEDSRARMNAMFDHMSSARYKDTV